MAVQTTQDVLAGQDTANHRLFPDQDCKETQVSPASVALIVGYLWCLRFVPNKNTSCVIFWFLQAIGPFVLFVLLLRVSASAPLLMAPTGS